MGHGRFMKAAVADEAVVEPSLLTSTATIGEVADEVTRQWLNPAS